MTDQSTNAQFTTKITPAYIGFATWQNFIGGLKDTTIPPRIDNTVMSGKSGSVQSQLRTANKFLGLVDKNDGVTPRLRTLVKAHGTDDWPDAMREVVEDAYAPILKGLPMDNGTAQQLHERFRDVGDITGSSMRKGIRFFLMALEAAGIKHSPHFKAPKAPPSRKRTNGASSEKKSGVGTGDGGKTGDEVRDKVDAPPPEGFQRIAFPLPRFSQPVGVDMPKNITEREWNAVDRFIRDFIEMTHGADEE